MPEWERPCLRLLNWAHNYGRPQDDLRVTHFVFVSSHRRVAHTHKSFLFRLQCLEWMGSQTVVLNRLFFFLVFVCVCICEWEGLCDTHMWCMCLYMVGDYAIVCMKGGGECWLSFSVLPVLFLGGRYFFLLTPELDQWTASLGDSPVSTTQPWDYRHGHLTSQQFRNVQHPITNYIFTRMH